MLNLLVTFPLQILHPSVLYIATAPLSGSDDSHQFGRGA
jgi:hypothetical protein